MRVGDTRSEHRHSKLQKLRRQTEIDDIRAVMSTEQGRRLIARILNEGNPFDSPFNTNAMTMSYNVGRQDGAKWIIAEIDNACPEKYVVMMVEARKLKKRFAREDNDEDTQDD